MCMAPNVSACENKCGMEQFAFLNQSPAFPSRFHPHSPIHHEDSVRLERKSESQSTSPQCFLFSFDIFFIYISNISLFPGLPFRNPLYQPPLPCLYEVLTHPTTLSLLFSLASPTLGHQIPSGPMATPPTDVPQGLCHILARDMGPSMCILRLVVQSPGAQEGLAC